MQCDRCTGKQFTRAGRDRQRRQLYRCHACGRRMTVRSGSAFSGYRFPDDIIASVVRWYLRYRLSYADVAEWLAERGINVDPSTIYDWVRTFTLHFIDAARMYRSPVGRRWRVDETYLKIDGRQRYLFRAIDEHGQIVDVYFSDRRDTAAARRFLKGRETPVGVRPRALPQIRPSATHPRCVLCCPWPSIARRNTSTMGWSGITST